jgi:SSS family solute:Na+ symporter
MVGLVMAVLTAALVSTVSSALNALSTVFTMDIYVQKFKPEATTKQIIRIGRVVVLVGAVVAIALTLAIDSIKGLNLFNIFQSVLGFIAPPMAAVFLFGVFWKKTTSLAANLCLTLGTVFSLGTGIAYFLTNTKTDVWPHFMMLSFILFVIICLGMFVVTFLESLGRKAPSQNTLDFGVLPKTTKPVWAVWVALIVVMVALYVVFNGH